MLMKRNLLESVTIVSCSVTVICILLNYITNISPITGIWFHLYILILFLVSVSLSFKFIQWLLRLNKPVKYDLEKLVADYPHLSFLSRILPSTSNRILSPERNEYDTNELSVISTVLERKLVSSWYMQYISQEIGFPFACKQMLDQMIGKTFQICNKIETKEVFVDICTILVSHLKEYKKAIKRQAKSPPTSIESLYNKSHQISDNKCESGDHCTFILRIILKELIPWELWDTPHSELLVRILSKKLDNFIDNTLADPLWLNDKLLTVLNKKSDVKEEVKQEKKEEPENETIVLETASVPIDSAPKTVEEEVTKPVIDEKIENIVEEVAVSSSEPVDIKSSPVLRQQRGRQGRNEVKIYDRIIEGTVKTWETDIDLQCISLGQDLLASLDGEITLSRLWGQEDADGSPNPPRSKSPQPLWFGEEDIDLDLDTSPQKEAKKEQSPKPGDALLKDLQTTVHQAKTKIGDLQVQANVNLDVPRKQYSSDEAAGMMEGLLDFGIAGLKKGLRFTGLSDDSQEKLLLHHREKTSDRSSPPEVIRPKNTLEREVVTPSVVQKEDNGPNSIPPLVKQNRVISQDSIPSQPKPIRGEIPPPLPPLPLPDSPEPEYEEAADLSTSIAKLRCLLQQRAETSPRGEEIWWEGAEETRGRTHRHRSSRPVDTATLADEYDMNVERNTSPGQTSNNMQRLDKLFHRTVTGVFNSIKTAVGAEGEETSSRPLHDWTYVCTSMELSVCGAVSRMVGGRRALGHVDAALDSLHQLGHKIPDPLPPPEDFEEWCATVGAAWSGLCAASGAAGLGRAHVTHRIATLLFADLAESLLTIWLEDLATWLRKQVFVEFEQMSRQEEPCFTRDRDLMEFHLDETCDAVMQRVPLLHLFGEETLSTAVKLIISSFSHKELNKDVIFRTLDLFANHFNKSAALRNPSFDAN